jgi:hypothetical protein
MIVSFRDRETERIWTGEGSRRLPPWILGVAIASCVSSTGS